MAGRDHGAGIVARESSESDRPPQGFPRADSVPARLPARFYRTIRPRWWLAAMALGAVCWWLLLRG